MKRLLLLTLALSLLAVYQTQTPTHEALLQHPSKLKSLSGTLTVRGQEGKDQWEMVYRVDFQHPNKFRIQTVAIQSSRPQQPVLLISNGTEVQRIEVKTNQQKVVQWSEFKPENLSEETTSLLLLWLFAPDRLKNTLRTQMQADPNLTSEKVKWDECQVARWHSKANKEDLEFAFWVAADGVPRQAAISRKGETSFTIREQWSDLKIDQPIEESRFALQVSQPEPTTVADKPSESTTTKAPESTRPRGPKAPDFTLRTLSGQTTRLSALRGKPVFLDFWATWCGPCRMTLPHTQALYRQYGDKVHVFAINLREDTATIRAFLQQNRYTFPVLLDRDGRVAKTYGVRGIPTFVLIDQEGSICWSKVGGSSNMDREIYAVLKELGIQL